MKPKTLILLVVAGGCGLVAMLGVQQAMQNNTAAAKVETKKVLVALENIETGSMLTPETVAFQERPVDSLPPAEELILKPEDYDKRGARIPLFAGDVVTLSKLSDPGGTGNSIKIPKGMRVITIPVTENESHSNLISPGDRVDVLVTYRSRGGRGGSSTTTKTLLEYVEIFATGAKTSEEIKNNDKNSRTNHVSLLLIPEHVHYVKLAESKGTLSLSWRHKLDDELVQTKDIDEELFEELKGTPGINESQSIYASNFGADAVSSVYPPTTVTSLGSENPDSAQQLVDQVMQQSATPATEATPTAGQVAQVAVKEKTKPKWTMHVYNGNTAVPHEFEIEEESTEGAAAESGDTNPFADAVRSLFGSDS